MHSFPLVDDYRTHSKPPPVRHLANNLTNRCGHFNLEIVALEFLRACDVKGIVHGGLLVPAFSLGRCLRVKRSADLLYSPVACPDSDCAEDCPRCDFAYCFFHNISLPGFWFFSLPVGLYGQYILNS